MRKLFELDRWTDIGVDIGGEEPVLIKLRFEVDAPQQITIHARGHGIHELWMLQYEPGDWSSGTSYFLGTFEYQEEFELWVTGNCQFQTVSPFDPVPEANEQVWIFTSLGENYEQVVPEE